MRFAPFRMAPASEAPSGSRVITLGTPSWMPNSTYDDPPTWNSGIDTIDLSPGSNSQPSWALTVCWTMLVWVSITPLGRPVVPEEYITRQTSSGRRRPGATPARSAASQASYSSPSPAVRRHLDDPLDAGSRSRILSTSGISSLPTNSTRAPQSLTA